MNALLLTLGHNSSAIYVGDYEESIIGYEQERLDQIKSSAQFPIDSISAINKYKSLYNKKQPIFISHWFDNFNVENKYYNKRFLNQLGDDIIYCNDKFTHHDAHMVSSYSFVNYFYNKEFIDGDIHYIVADGFGNNQEVISIYKSENIFLKPELIFRIQNYKASLGLMYQFATSFCGMKENQDEYKFLGYESVIDKILTIDEINSLKDKVEKQVEILLNLKDTFISHDNLINYNYLGNVKKYWYNIFESIVDNQYDKEEIRTIIAFFIQNIIELYFKKIIDIFSIKNVVLSGGCFYNVKLNNCILKNIEGYISIVPLAGDQGAAIGLYFENFKYFNWGDLCWGKRNLFGIEKYNKDNIYCVDNDKSVELISDFLEKDMLVNVISGDMEFGPRALCNTSTIMLPKSENVKLNNYLNKRNEVMPMAPVILQQNKDLLFKDECNRVIGSDKFMIITFDYHEFDEELSGVSHKYPLSNVYSGRPQVVTEDVYIGKVLKNINQKALINTSFNAHGRPIVFETSSIIQNYEFQLDRCEDKKKLALIIIKNE